MAVRKLVFLVLLLCWASAAIAAQCSLTGQVFNIDGTPCANCTITMNPVTQQPLVTGGTSYTLQPISTTTDANGNLAAVSLPQGLIVLITVSENGATFGGYTAIVPFMSAATFTQLNQGISTQPLNVLASSQPPTGPLSMNNQKITTLACPSVTDDALAWGCDATVGNLTVNGGFTQSVSGMPVFGRISASQIADPSAPTVTQLGTTGSATYLYAIACHSGNTVQPDTTNASSFTTITNGNGTLSGTNKVQVSWTFPAHAKTCDVIKTDTSHAAIGGTGLTASPFFDTNTGTVAYTAPSRNTTGDIIAAGHFRYSGTGTMGNAPMFSFFQHSTTYTVPSWDPYALVVKLSGGGGGGGGATQGSGSAHSGGGGGAGAYTQCVIVNPTPGTNYTVTIGAGGTAGTCAASPVAGTAGGASTFNAAAFCTAAGGSPGVTPTGGLDGPGGAGGAAVATTTSSNQVAQMVSSVLGQTGSTGATSTVGVGGIGAGANGGTATGTDSGGNCTIAAATAGNSGWVSVEAFPEEGDI